MKVLIGNRKEDKMLDIKLIRENPEKINELLKRRNPDLSIAITSSIDKSGFLL